MVIANPIWMLSAYAYGSTALPGVFVGFSQCGGYRWHEQLFNLHTVVCLVGLGILSWRRDVVPKVHAASVVLGLAMVWYLAQVMGSALYGQGIAWGLGC